MSRTVSGTCRLAVPTNCGSCTLPPSGELQSAPGSPTGRNGTALHTAAHQLPGASNHGAALRRQTPSRRHSREGNTLRAGPDYFRGSYLPEIRYRGDYIPSSRRKPGFLPRNGTAPTSAAVWNFGIPLRNLRYESASIRMILGMLLNISVAKPFRIQA